MTEPARPVRRWPRLATIAAPLVVVGLLLSSSGTLTTPGATASPTASLVTPAMSSPTGTADANASPPPSPSSAIATPQASPTASLPPPRAPGDYLLMTRAELLALPTSGPAWDAVLADAVGPPGRARLRDQDVRHGVTTLAAALVYARTGDPDLRERARGEIMEAIGTEREGANNSILALGRQLGAYVLAADFIDLSGADDDRFRAWLDPLRTSRLGGHGRWTSLAATHEDSANNWGAFAGASRIAASLYLGDGADVALAAQVLRGFLGDATAWNRFQPVEDSASWACDPQAFVPIDPPCRRAGIDLDGAIVRDIDRGGSRRWPPGDTGVGYTLEALQGLTLQAELLTENGYGDAWRWSDEALRRAAQFVTRAGEAGGESWNRSAISHGVPWLLNARYGLGLPTEPAGQGRVLGYTDWLYGP